MSLEFIKLSKEETNYGNKTLLSTQLDAITLVQRLKRYKILRNEELGLKVILKIKLDEALANLDILDKILPKTTVKEGTYEFPEMKKDKERETLSDEIEEIKRKLFKLQA